jgi:hypothetical protein
MTREQPRDKLNRQSFFLWLLANALTSRQAYFLRTGAGAQSAQECSAIANSRPRQSPCAPLRSRAQSLLGIQFGNLGCDRKIFEVGQVPPYPSSFHPSQLVFGLALGGDIFGVDRLGF